MTADDPHWLPAADPGRGEPEPVRRLASGGPAVASVLLLGAVLVDAHLHGGKTLLLLTTGSGVAVLAGGVAAALLAAVLRLRARRADEAAVRSVTPRSAADAVARRG